MISYAGAYTFDVEKVIHHVDNSWNQKLDRAPIRCVSYKLDGNSLTITSALAKNFTDGREGHSILVWERLTP
jgi:hypothetical protein